MFEPIAHPLGIGCWLLALLTDQRELNAFDQNLAANAFGKAGGEAERDLPTQRMPDNVDVGQPACFNYLSEIANIARQGVVAVAGPVAVPVTPQIGRNDAVPVGERLRDP